jgi:lipoate-protein ligase A
VTFALPCADWTFPTPAENLAADEALLDWCEEGDGPGALRFWESPEPFVVLGHGNHCAREVNVEACRSDGVAILRRCTGGGAVLQGPGCLNYAIVLRIDRHRALESVTGTNRFVMERNARALSALSGQEIMVRGFTDLTLGALKFSGNAAGRDHAQFLTGFNADRNLIKSALAHEWGGTRSSFPLDASRIGRLVAEKYGRTEWNLKW